MDPNALAAIIGGSLVVATIGLVWALVVWSRGTRDADVEARDGIIADLRRTLEGERRRERIRAAGAVADLQRAAALAAASATGDVDGVLLAFPDDGTNRAPGESGGAPDATDAGVSDA